jgi:hypothetical protein
MYFLDILLDFKFFCIKISMDGAAGFFHDSQERVIQKKKNVLNTLWRKTGVLAK